MINTSQELFQDLKKLLGITQEGVTNLRLVVNIDQAPIVELDCIVHKPNEPIEAVTKKYRIEPLINSEDGFVDVTTIEDSYRNYVKAENS